MTNKKKQITNNVVIHHMTNQKKQITHVVFRKFKDNGQIIALFPYEIENGYNISSYMGQHSAADYNTVIKQTKPATEKEYESLKKELESYPEPYHLKVIKKYSYKKFLEAYRIANKRFIETL